MGEGLADWPDFSRERIVPSAGRRFRTSMRMVYDFATLKRIFGMSSDTNLSIIGRIESLITSRLMAGAKVLSRTVRRKYLQKMTISGKLTEIAKQVVIR